ESQVGAEVEAAQRTAENAPWPDLASAATHIYAQSAIRNPQSAIRKEEGREISFMQATLEALSHEMAHNPRIFVLGEGIGKRGGHGSPRQLLPNVRSLPRAGRRRPFDAVRRQRVAAPRPPLRRPRPLPRTSRLAVAEGAGARRGLRNTLRPGSRGARGAGCYR